MRDSAFPSDWATAQGWDFDHSQNTSTSVATIVATRLSGPPNSALDTLTVRIVLRDGAGTTIQEAWHVYDLSEVPRGGPKDFTIRIPSQTPADGLGVDIVSRPDENDQPHIPELNGLTP